MIGNNNLKVDYKKNENTIIISNINTRVTSVNINYTNNLTDKITYKLKYVATENSDLISLNPKIILENEKQYINFDTHSDCKSIQIDLETESYLEIDNIIINHVNFNINMYRVLLIFIIISFCMIVKKNKLMK